MILVAELSISTFKTLAQIGAGPFTQIRGMAWYSRSRWSSLS